MPADLLITGGTVRTGDPDRPTATSVAVTRGRVSGLDDAASDQRGPGTDVVDLAGGALLPSFGDGHAHPLWGGVELAWAPVRDLGSVAEVVEVVRLHAAAHPDDPWVLGGSYDPRWRPAACSTRACWTRWCRTGRCSWSRATTTARGSTPWRCGPAGITAQTPDPPAARIARRPDGEPLGTLLEWRAVDLVQAHLPAPTHAAKLRAVTEATALLAAAGVTWVQDAALAPEDVVVYLEAAAAGLLKTRVNIALRAEPDHWKDQVATFAAARAATSATRTSARAP